MRQALDSDIIRISMDVRNGKKLEPYNGKDVKIVKKKDLVDGMFSWADIILCGRNNTRQLINNQVRQMKGFKQEPQVGDKIICCQNYWDIVNGFENPLINGMIGTIENIKLGVDNGVLGRDMTIDFLPEFLDKFNTREEGLFKNKRIDYKFLTTGNPTYTKDAKPTYKRGKKIHNPLLFEYGYAITSWRAQGSQWNKVLFIPERFKSMSNDDYTKFCYTSITRAAKKLVIII